MFLNEWYNLHGVKGVNQCSTVNVLYCKSNILVHFVYDHALMYSVSHDWEYAAVLLSLPLSRGNL